MDHALSNWLQEENMVEYLTAAKLPEQHPRINSSTASVVQSVTVTKKIVFDGLFSGHADILYLAIRFSI